ncbi:MAG: AI-2E family transporter [Hyphomicrobium sp.]
MSATLDDSGEALRLWLGAQLLAMILVGAMTGIGLAIIGVPSAARARLRRRCARVRAHRRPGGRGRAALLLASTQSWELAAWTLALFVVVQQVESNIIMPLVSGRAVDLPPAVGLFAVIAIGILFGPLGCCSAIRSPSSLTSPCAASMCARRWERTSPSPARGTRADALRCSKSRIFACVQWRAAKSAMISDRCRKSTKCNEKLMIFVQNAFCPGAGVIAQHKYHKLRLVRIIV